MGTASLVFGVILIAVGAIMFFYVFTYAFEPDTPTYAIVLALLLLAVPEIVVGGLLIRKYDKDKKKP